MPEVGSGRLTSVSVALCTHNGMPFVEAQIASILAQSTPPNQLVLSDDASTDATVPTVRDAVDRFTLDHPDHRIELTVIENAVPLRVVKNFEQAVTACTGELIVLCDQDDAWHPDRVVLAVAEFERRPELTLLHANARLVETDGTPIGYSLFEAIGMTPSELAEIHRGDEFATLLRRNVVTGATTVFRRTLLEHALPFVEHWVHDEWLAMLASVIGRTDALELEVIDYRQHGANQIGARKRSVGEGIAELRAPRGARSSYLVARAEALQTRFEQLGDLIPPDAVDRVAEKVQHERRRRDLPRLRLARLGGILREHRSGAYRQFGRARYDIVRDLFQPGA